MALVERLAIIIDGDGRGAIREFRLVGAEARRNLGAAETGAARFGLVAKRVGASTAVGLGVAAFGAYKLANAASAVNEQISASGFIFRDNAKDVQRWSGSLAKNFGISQRQALTAANSFGNLFTNIGFSTARAEEFSEGLVELAGDLASFRDVSTEQALRALQSGLVGEQEPLRRLGIFLSDDAVRAKALALGLAETSAEVSDAAKLQARYAIILEQSTTAQGDFARTSGNLANQKRKLAAEVENLSAKLGQVFIPVVTATVGVLGDVVGALDEFIDRAGRAADKLGLDSLAERTGNFFDKFKLGFKVVKEFAADPLGGLDEAQRDVAESTLRHTEAVQEGARAMPVYGREIQKVNENLEEEAEAYFKLLSLDSKREASLDAVHEAQTKLASVRAASITDDIRVAEDALSSARIGQQRATDRLADAQARLNDLRNQDASKLVGDAARAEAEAITRLHRAQQDRINAEDELSRLRDTGSTPNQVAEGTIKLEEATNEVASAQAAVLEATKELEKRRKNGNQDEIRDAEHDVAEAAIGVRDATRDIAEAQREVNEQRSRNRAREIASAERELKDAIIGQAVAFGEVARQVGASDAGIRAEIASLVSFRDQLGVTDVQITQFVDKRIADLQRLAGIRAAGPHPALIGAGPLLPGQHRIPDPLPIGAGELGVAGLSGQTRTAQNMSITVNATTEASAQQIADAVASRQRLAALTAVA